VVSRLPNVVVEPFDPKLASEADLAGYYRVVVASQEVDRPGEQPLTYQVAVERLTTPFPGLGPVAWWIARDREAVVGVANVHFPEAENRHVGLTEVTVHPEFRRRRIGTSMLTALVPELAARGRRVVEGWQVIEGSAGDFWAKALGFRPVRAIVTQVLTIAEADRSLWTVDVPAGYRLRRWVGVAPQDVLASYAHARSAIHDAPMGATAFRQPDWTVDRVREVEADYQLQGIEQRVVVAVHEATDRVAALTEVIVHPHRPNVCFQGDTAVLGEHRGRGLGRCVKGQMAHWLLADHPNLERIRTNTSADNTHMIRVNHQLGYRTVRKLIAMRAELAELRT
jgi:mycothiol synthase